MRGFRKLTESLYDESTLCGFQKKNVCPKVHLSCHSFPCRPAAAPSGVPQFCFPCSWPRASLPVECSGRRAPHLGEQHHKAAAVGELKVLGVEVMQSGDVALNQVLLLIVQLIQICGYTTCYHEEEDPAFYSSTLILPYLVWRKGENTKANMLSPRKLNEVLFFLLFGKDPQSVKCLLAIYREVDHECS